MLHPMPQRFRALHNNADPFILMNVWDAGSARMMAAFGAKALGTSSAAHAFTLGLPDGGQITRDQALDHAQGILEATSLPVSGDFENGFGDAPDDVAETVRLSGEVGLAGISIEDTALPLTDAYDFDLAVERIRAGAAMARTLPHDFILLARADGVMTGQYDLDEAIRRIQAFETAGADAVYVPMPGTLADLKRICDSTSLPVNALAAGPLAQHSLAEFAAIGVARVSLGSMLARCLHQTLYSVGKSAAQGDFSGFAGAISSDLVDELLQKGS